MHHRQHGSGQQRATPRQTTSTTTPIKRLSWRLLRLALMACVIRYRQAKRAAETDDDVWMSGW